MIDQSARTLLEILRSTAYLVSYYGKYHEVPKIGAFKHALIETIAELGETIAKFDAARAVQAEELEPLVVTTWPEPKSVEFEVTPSFLESHLCPLTAGPSPS